MFTMALVKKTTSLLSGAYLRMLTSCGFGDRMY
jgi:hypothetical protein